MGKSKNAPKPTAESQTIALYAFLLMRDQGAVKTAQRRLAVMAKEAAQHGVSWADVKAALKEYEQSPAARQAKAERLSRVFGAIGVPAQLELFDAYVPRANDTEAEAEKKGWLAAICQGEATPPYDPGSREGQAWLKGWNDLYVLVDGYAKRFEAEANGEGADDWDEKPVASVEALKSAESVQ